jgi:hypothetical protein
MSKLDALSIKAGDMVPKGVLEPNDWIKEYNKRFAELIVQECIWAFGETRTEPSLEKYILDRLGVEQ